MSRYTLLHPLAAPLFFALSLFSTQALADTTAGKTAYQQYCQACHQADGTGVPGAFPPIANNPNVVGKPEYIAQAVIGGVNGPLEVNGTQYNGVMPSMAYISNEVIADLANFIEQEWNGSGTKVTAEDIEALR